MNDYRTSVLSIKDISFNAIRQNALQRISHLSEEDSNRIYSDLDRGVKLLETNEELCMYLRSYGKMHQEKIRLVCGKLPLQEICSKQFHIIDWGCGQGLASICFLDKLSEESIQHTNPLITLIEPSSVALNRAQIHLEAYVGKENVKCINKYIDDINVDEITSSAPYTIHLFSNVLDIKTIDLKLLASKVGSNKLDGIHYVCCVGPLYSNNTRIDAFYNHFDAPEIIFQGSKAEYFYEQSKKCSYDIRVFKLEHINGKTLFIEYQPAVQFHAASILDCVGDAIDSLSVEKQKQAKSLLHFLSNFEVSAPFDIGASAYDDIHPILAVLHNIIVRGLPTKASPYIEECFKFLGNKKADDSLGSIIYDAPCNEDDVFMALHALDNRVTFNDRTYNSPLLESDFEKAFVFNALPPYLRHLFLPQRSLASITNDRERHHSQRVDFSCEFPYSEAGASNGIVYEIDGAAYHSDESAKIRDAERVRILQNVGWSCLRISDIKDVDLSSIEQNIPYLENVKEAYSRELNEDWRKYLQLTLSPIGVSRIQKTVIEAILTGRLDIANSELKILVLERDVPCAVMALEELARMHNTLTSLSEDFKDMKFPQIVLDIISTDEFASSGLHSVPTNHIRAKVHKSSNNEIRKRVYDAVIDIAVMRHSSIEDISFTDYQCNNKCYFNIRSANYNHSNRHIYTTETINYRTIVEKTPQGEYREIEDRKDKLRYFLRMLFRKDDFRPGQLPIMSRALQNKCVIGLLPTGGGKSLTYQLAAMLQPGITIVIDPLRSLMKDQYDGLIKTGIDSCTFINSTKDADEKENRAIQMEHSQMHFVFLSPERLCIYGFREKLRNMQNLGVYFAYGVIDEVHCVSEWGHDFRFTYLHLGRNLYRYVFPKQTDKHKELTLIGLTATASFDVLADVERELSGNGAFELDADSIVRYENTNRLELQYRIECVPVKFEEDPYYDENKKVDPTLPRAVLAAGKWAFYNTKLDYLKAYLPTIPDLVNQLQKASTINRIKQRFAKRQNLETAPETDLTTNISNNFFAESPVYENGGIVFCPHKTSTGLSVKKNAATLVDVSPQIGTFMGSSDSEDSDAIDKKSFENLEKFRANKIPLMVATKAFGMGIDKPNVRFTVNMNYPSSLESFVQEAGRAGRDRKIALATILLADYHLVRINKQCPSTAFPLMIIKNKWFRDGDLQRILEHYNIRIEEQYIDHCTPNRDMAQLRCDVCHTRYAFNLCNTACSRCNKGPCNPCSEIGTCSLTRTPQTARGYMYIDELNKELRQSGLNISARMFQYQNIDYETVMYFYNNNFKGAQVEKKTMHDILSKSSTSLFIGDDAELKECIEVPDFLDRILSSPIGEEVVAFISAIPIYEYTVQGRKMHGRLVRGESKKIWTMEDQMSGMRLQVNKEDVEPYRDKSDVAKAIYRMCCIGLIDDFTEVYDRHNPRYRVVAIRKQDGEYYHSLQTFLERYYTKERAELEIVKVPNYKGNNEVQKCLGYLTEFIYDKIAVKRKQAIDDMRAFCMTGLNGDWLAANEELKDFIYYYFNSKYARKGYKTEETDIPFSLTDDTDGGKICSYDILFKYLRVTDEDVIGTSSPKDNIKHLQGAVRLIRRSLTDSNPALDLLNVFCLLYLKVGKNKNLQQELKDSYINGYTEFYYRTSNKNEFYQKMTEYKDALVRDGRKAATKAEIKQLLEWDLECEVMIHSKWLTMFTKNYTEKTN